MCVSYWTAGAIAALLVVAVPFAYRVGMVRGRRSAYARLRAAGSRFAGDEG